MDFVQHFAERLLITVWGRQGKFSELYEYAVHSATTPEVQRMFLPENLGAALYGAVGRDDAAFARFLLEKDAPVDYIHEESRETSLHAAVRRDNPKIVRLLIEHHADVFVKNAQGITAFHAAKQRGYAQCMAQFDREPYRRHYQGYLTVFPVGGSDGIDYFSASGFDNDPESMLPLTIPRDTAAAIVGSQLPEDKLALFRKYYYPDDGVYRLIRLQDQVQLETVWVARILIDWGMVDASVYRRGTALDYMGNARTYDNHIGHDFSLVDYQLQDYGVPVYAAADGRVIVSRKGSPDREVKPGEEQGENTVYIDHGYDRVTYYNHLRRDVLVDEGDFVYAGQQIAWVGSAGRSTSGKTLEAGSSPTPHLHFSVIEWGEWLEPYEGPSHNEPSRWRKQPPYRQPLRLLDFGISKKSEIVGSPLVTPKRRFYRLNEEDTVIWFLYYFLEPGISLKYRILSPAGDEVYADTVSLENDYWHRYVIDLSSVDFYASTWTVRIEKDTVSWFECTLTVIGGEDTAPPNRAPRPPSNPRMSHIDTEQQRIYRCSVDFPYTYIDPDLDRMRYRYVWQVDGKPIRDVTMASHLDYLPAHMVGEAASVECSIYAYDGHDYSQPVEAGLLL